MASGLLMVDHESQVIEMNELNQLIQNVTLTCMFFGAVLAVCIGVDVWAQRLSQRRASQAVRAYMAPRKRL